VGNACPPTSTSSGTIPEDAQIRLAASSHIKQIASDGTLTSDDLRAGFDFQGQRVPLVNPQRGIFKPAIMRYLLSIRTVFPRTGARVWYDDQRAVHKQIEQGDELVEYAFMGTDPEAADNRWLREAWTDQVPIIYFLGVAPGRYTAIWPTYIAEWSAAQLKAQLAFGAPDAAGKTWVIPEMVERRYGLRLVRQRLHQATFREAVLTAYGYRCAISGLPEPRLLDAAHIIADRDEERGQPVVRNGLPLSKLHHAAFDLNLIGIDPDCKIHISEALLAMRDGPLFEQGIKAMAGRSLLMPRRPADYPDRDRLSERFEQFRAMRI
jgi:putative restriction endonuclease